ncbi:MAG: hypothetical protein LBQ14_01305 [Treponema sp.]|jgi:hypothetical protein|nr:hypothetical protein [Treponema sp.]
MKAYFIQIATVRLAARLLGKELIDNYGFHGTLPRYSSIHLKGITEAEGIDGVPLKADSFNLGCACGTVIGKYLDGAGTGDILYMEAAVAQNIFLDMNPEKRARYTDAELREFMGLIFHALLKRAQIRTHTAKPGAEDINAWLAGYYRLEQDCAPFVSSLLDAIISPDPVLSKKHAAFFDKEDPLVALALKDAVPAPEALKSAAGTTPRSIFGRILREIIS